MDNSPYEPHDNVPHQGSLYRDIKVVTAPSPNSSGEVSLSEWTLPYAVVLSQECDLLFDQKLRSVLIRGEQGEAKDRNENHDKLLLAILMCPAYQAELFRVGSHLNALQRRMESYNSERFKSIKQNLNLRYHYFAGWTPFQIPELIVDFKHFFTIPVEQLLEYGTVEHYITRLKPLYREDFSQRCAAYLTRIGVPIPHDKISPDNSGGSLLSE
jgi:hypothetical protein